MNSKHSKNKTNKSTSSIVLFHRIGEDVLMRTGVLNGLDYHIYEPEEDIRYGGWGIICALIYCLRFRPQVVERNYLSFGFLRVLAREFKGKIIADNLRKLQPKVVLTWIDNSDSFHRASKAYCEIPFLAIANSARTTWCATDALPDPEGRYHIDEYFCYGPRMQSMFERYRHSIKKYVRTGSLPGGYYFSSYRNSHPVGEKKYDICIVSQWHKNAWNNTTDSIFATGKALDVLASYTSRYAAERKIKVCIALRANDPDEKQYFNEHFSGECVFPECDRETFSSYRAADMSNLVVAINSSLSVELFGGGLKVLFVNPSGQDRIRQTDSIGVWYLSEPTYDDFSERVDLLLGMGVDDYQLEASGEIKNVMSYDLSKPAHDVIRERLQELSSV